MQRVGRSLLAVAALIAVALAGCSWLGYSAHVGTWDASYQDTDTNGDPVETAVSFTLEMDSFTMVSTSTFLDTSQSELRLRGDLAVTGHLFDFQENEIGFDDDTMTAYAFIIALAGDTFTLMGQEWMDIGEFEAEVHKFDPEFTTEMFALGEVWFTILDDTMTFRSDAGTFEYTRR